MLRYVIILQICLIYDSFKFRNAVRSDVKEIAKLLTTTFDNNVAAWDLVGKFMAKRGMEEQIMDRIVNLIEAGATHSMIVAVDDNKNVAGFMELGTMPSPVPQTKIWEGVTHEVRPEMPFLGNVAVHPNYRRQRIGSRMVKLAIKCAEKWYPIEEEERKDNVTVTATAIANPRTFPALFLAVENSNLAAIKMYGKLNFDIVIDESMDMSTPFGRTPRLYFRKILH
jgi:ribosomal protein S18 acetylase RimI-like enzyme